MPSPALAAATAANTAANTNSSANRQMIIQQYQQQQQQQQHHQNQLNMGMSMPMQQGAANGGPGTINTMMSLHGPAPYMLPSPQSAGGPSSLPALPPQSTDLDSILAKYANQPELLKLIIASKTEEDRRWAEEARYRMMDLIMRGDNRGASMASFEALGGVPGNMPGMMGMPPKRLMEEGYVHPSFGGFPPSGPGLGAGGPGSGGASGPGGAPGSAGGLPGLNPPSTSAGSSSAGFPSMYAQSQMPNAFGMGMGGMHGSQPMMNQAMGGGPNGFGQYVDPSLARKRSVTFAGEVHHMRSQSLSSMPSPNGAGQLGGMPMLGMGGGADAFGQHQQQQQPSHQQQGGALQSSQQYQFQQQQQQQAQPQQMHFHHHSSQSFSGAAYPHQPFGQQHTLPSLNHHGVIRRTNSLSHLPQTQITVTEPRLVAGRPRNDSSTSIRTMDDDNSDEDSDDDYDNHPITGGMASRPGSALSIHNNIGGNHETSLTLEFSDMASVSGHHHHHGHDHHGEQGQANSSSSFNNNSSGGGHAKGHRSTSSTSSMSGMAGAGADHKRKRKRREMQPVNKIVDSPEPHSDPFLWKNNGNTTQKKTGCKSIYYKCSNSTAGCTVNKTVTEKEGGGYVTKYRGEHLDDCNRLKRAQQLAHQPAHNGHLQIQNE
ncbi:hypothetical protein EDD21DRAFT_377985 [Dissophora ornata]|nr:hypothetical protein EDD21DRAFT_377985 [Dissophora ornata]